ncbi:MAG: NAD-dependent epimerase/dehydratase family protein [Verrucomicrobiota bacterium]
MSKRTMLVTGSAGLIGSEVATHFSEDRGYTVHGLDNNERAHFFGPDGDTLPNLNRLQTQLRNYIHHDLDIRDRQGVCDLVAELRPSAIVHAAAQPSHDRAVSIPFADFEVNAVGTLNLLEAARMFCPESPFVHMSTNKVYGDAPNRIPMVELETRWAYASPEAQPGVDESMTVDQSTHSLFGVSKLAADSMVQEYGRYFGMPTTCLQAGCMTGPQHTGVELHGFLSYLVKCNVEGTTYTVHGYKGKQVRDNLHSVDVARLTGAIVDAPRCGEVYNIGGGQSNSLSILEAFALVEKHSGRAQRYTYAEKNRTGDHICYYTNLQKVRAHYPDWNITKTIGDTVHELVESRLSLSVSRS